MTHSQAFNNLLQRGAFFIAVVIPLLLLHWIITHISEFIFIFFMLMGILVLFRYAVTSNQALRNLIVIIALLSLLVWFGVSVGHV